MHLGLQDLLASDDAVQIAGGAEAGIQVTSGGEVLYRKIVLVALLGDVR